MNNDGRVPKRSRLYSEGQQMAKSVGSFIRRRRKTGGSSLGLADSARWMQPMGR